MSSVDLRTDKITHIAELVLNNPPANVLNTVMAAEITEAAKQVAQLVESNEVRVVLLRSEGKHFCAGADLKERLTVPESEVATVVKGIRGAIDGIWDLRVPVIALINGTALGGGMELALAADMRIVAEDSRMGLKEVTLGILPGAGGTQRLSRIVGMGRALEWIITGKDITPVEALNGGLVSEVVVESSLIEKGMEMARQIASNGPVGVQAAKKAVREGFDLPFEEALEIEWAEYLRTISTKDRVEGLNAFNEKRKPEYKGY